MAQEVSWATWALSLAAPTLMQHKLLVTLMIDLEGQVGPWQRVLRYGTGGVWALTQHT